MNCIFTRQPSTLVIIASNLLSDLLLLLLLIVGVPSFLWCLGDSTIKLTLTNHRSSVCVLSGRRVNNLTIIVTEETSRNMS